MAASTARPKVMLSISLVFLLISSARGFVARGPLTHRVGVRSSTGALVLRMTPEEERAELLAAYITKANEDKMKAVRAVEEMKDAEIAALKEQLKVAASSSPPSSLEVAEAMSDLESLSKDELISIIKSYQQMMPQFKVGKEKSMKSPVALSSNGSDGTLYQNRNARVVAAAAAGKSRWGSMEVDRAIFLTEKTNNQETADTAISTERNNDKFQMRNARLVAAASASKTRWGEMEVLRAQKLQGAPVPREPKAASNSPQPPATTSDKFQMRNSRVVAAAKAGKSRWGEMEVERLQNGVGGQVKAADHPVANGASHTPSTKPPPLIFELPPMDSKFQLRNARLVAAANVGKSRWGEMEVKRAQDLVGSVKATDHPNANGASKTVTTQPPLMADSSMDSKFQLRNARLVASANAGKSRWGEMEVKRAENLVSGSAKAADHPFANGASQTANTAPPPVISELPPMNTNFQQRNARVVAAANAGKSRWGEMEVKKVQNLVDGSTKATDHPAANGAPRKERITPPPVISEIPPMESSFQQRNARIAAAASAGKSRWGEMEVEKAQNLANGSVRATDHPVANGASHAVSASPSPMVANESVNPNFHLRNEKVAAAASAGKSRWGELEVLRIHNSGSGISEFSPGNSIAVNPGPLPTEANGKFQMRNARLVAAASAGMSRWGELEVMKAQMASNGMAGHTHNGATPAHGIKTVYVNSNYQLRNARLVQAARAGKTRWGEMEVLRAERST